MLRRLTQFSNVRRSSSDSTSGSSLVSAIPPAERIRQPRKSPQPEPGHKTTHVVTAELKTGSLVGLPQLTVEGLSGSDARALLDSVTLGRLDERVRDRIVAETRGNPLALLELPRGLSAAELAGGFGLPDALSLASRIERSFLRRLQSLPVKTRQLLIKTLVRYATARGGGRELGLARYATAVLHNGLGGYEAALAGARRACEYEDLGFFGWSLAELVEARTRSGASDEASAALRQLAERTSAAGSEWALGIQARSRALLSDGPAADTLYREAIDRLGRSRIAVHLARAHLVYGEWLRREQRRAEAREHLRAARGVPPAQGVLQARHQLPPAAPALPGAGATRTAHRLRPSPGTASS